MATSEIRLNVPLDQARQLIGSELSAQGFAVQISAGGSLVATRGSLGTTLVAGAFSGQDMHVKLEVDLAHTPSGARAEIRSSGVTGYLKGGIIGAARTGDAMQEAAHRLGTALAARGVLEGQVPVGTGAGLAAPAQASVAAAYASPPAGAYAPPAGGY